MGCFYISINTFLLFTKLSIVSKYFCNHKKQTKLKCSEKDWMAYLKAVWAGDSWVDRKEDPRRQLHSKRPHNLPRLWSRQTASRAVSTGSSAESKRECSSLSLLKAAKAIYQITWIQSLGPHYLWALGPSLLIRKMDLIITLPQKFVLGLNEIIQQHA